MNSKLKMMTGTIGMIILSLAGILLFSAFSAPADAGKTKVVLDIRNYLDKNVKPILQPQRVKLDQVLTAQEKKEVAMLNNQLRQLIAKRNTAGIGFLTSPDFSFSQVPELSGKQQAARKENRDEMRRIMARAWAIADNHEKEIAQLLGEKSNFYGTWKRGLSAIVKDYLDDKFLFIGSNQLMKRFENRGLITYYSPVAFLLWDPQQRFISDELLKK